MFENKVLLEKYKEEGFTLIKSNNSLYIFELICTGEISNIIFSRGRRNWNVELVNYAPYASMVKIIYDTLIFLENHQKS